MITRRLNENGETLFTASRNDSSPRHSYYPTGYDSRCSACWLNHSHSENYHTSRIGKDEDQS